MPSTLSEIVWETSLDGAEHRAAAEGRPVLIDFSAVPTCKGCVAMENETYPDPRVVEYLDGHFVPVRLMVRDKQAVATEYLVSWTPNIVIADRRGRVHHRIEGFLPPTDFIAQLSLGEGKYFLNLLRYRDAAARFEEVAERHSGSEAAAQALYWLGVARFKESHDAADLQTSWQRVAHEYPESEWAQRTRIPQL
jgi:Thioredoxin-like domain/Tetratricopeptide repeat